MKHLVLRLVILFILLSLANGIGSKKGSYLKITRRNFQPSLVAKSSEGFQKKKFPDYSSSFKTNQNGNVSATRQSFAKTVYSIFSLQIISTFVIAGLILTRPSLQAFATNGGVFLTSIIVSVVSFMLLSSVPSLRHTMPYNFLLMTLFTVADAITLGAISLQFDLNIVSAAFVHTIVAFLTITLFAWQTSLDLTGSNVAMALSVSLVASLLLQWCFPNTPSLHNLLAGLGAMTYALYLAHDTQLIAQGKHRKHRHPRNEPLLAVLSLYLDTTGLFIQLVELLDRMKKGNEEEKKRHKKR